MDPSTPRDDAGPETTRTGLRSLLELTNRLTEALDTEEVARIVVDEAQASVGAMMAILWFVDDPPTHADLARAIGIPPDSRRQYARIPLEPWLPMGDAMLRREPLFFESRADFRARYPAAEKDAPLREAAPELSYACLPLVAHGRASAGVCLAFSHARDFDENERMFLTVLAHHAAQALERSRLFEREKQTRRRLEGCSSSPGRCRPRRRSRASPCSRPGSPSRRWVSTMQSFGSPTTAATSGC
jgi:GAF domain-containing protein